MTTKQQVIYASNHQCYYCGGLIDDTTQFKLNSACVNLYIPKSLGGTNARDNLVASCYACSAFIKKNLDVTKLSLAAVRKFVNLERKRMHLNYCQDYADYVEEHFVARSKPQASLTIVAPAEPSGSLPKVEPVAPPIDQSFLDHLAMEKARLERVARANAFMDAKFALKPTPVPTFTDDEEDTAELARLEKIKASLDSQAS